MTTLTRPSTAVVSTGPAFSFLWLEITGKCGLSCSHCYAGSGPAGTHGSMTADDWRSVIAQAAELGVSMVQFIGGEPTLHPDFAALLRCAIEAGLAAEVYSNLTHVRDSWWELLACPKVSLATSYYSDDPSEHDAITGRPGSHARTLASIRQAVSRGIPVRAGIVELADGQRTGQARAELEAIGVTRIRMDGVRRLGRAASSGPDVSQLCGNCGRGIAAVLPSGDVCPCVMARWLTAGNVRELPLAAILSGPALAAATAAIPARSRLAGRRDDCAPDSDSDICPPPAAASDCAPDSDSDICPPPAMSGCGPDCTPSSGDSDGCQPGGTVVYAIGRRGESA
jgi:MoaA/NifB/PqqE/SkfB family radical SAM enzyme